MKTFRTTAVLVGLFFTCAYIISVTENVSTLVHRIAGPSTEGVRVDERHHNFTFPSRDARFRYYMGDWYDHTLDPNDIPCDEIASFDELLPGQAVMYSARWIEDEIKKKKLKAIAGLARAYLVHAFDVMNSTEIDPTTDDWQVILLAGDKHSHSTKLPVVAKTRFSRFAREKDTGKSFFDPIIWPLELERHYNPIGDYTQLLQKGNVTKWEDKKPSLIWRGGFTGFAADKNLTENYVDGGPRIQAVRANFHEDTSAIDIAFQAGSPTTNVPFEFNDTKSLVRKSNTNMIDQLKHKYILSIEGNDVATGLKWQLVSNSVVFMAKPTTVSFLMEDLLEPFVHYVPVKEDHSDLVEMVNWARRNDDKCKLISEQATAYIDRLWMSEEAKADNIAIVKKLGEAYHKQFEDAMKTCNKK